MITAVLCMAYGSPRHLDEVEGYLKDIRGGREPSSDSVEELVQRYLAIGGASPLTELTQRQSSALQRSLDQREAGSYRTYVGMKHWHPFIRETMEKIAADGVERIVGLVLAPHFSKMSIGGYESRVLKAIQEIDASLEFKMVPHWYEEPGFVEFYGTSLMETLGDWDTSDGTTRVFFTAHSLPERILAEGDPYKDQLIESSSMIAKAASVPDWEFAFQSASATGEPWLGPNILESLEAFARSGGRRAVVAPIGFTADHLEILYDVDVECAAKCSEVGLEFRRTRSPNDDARFVEALAEVVVQT